MAQVIEPLVFRLVLSTLILLPLFFKSASPNIFNDPVSNCGTGASSIFGDLNFVEGFGGLGTNVLILFLHIFRRKMSIDIPTI